MGKDENEWLSEQFAELTGLLLAADSVDEVLRHIVTAAMVLIPAADLASITLRSPDGRFSTPARSDSIATELDEAQYRDGKGPCVEAARPDGPAYAVSEDLAGERRWPLFAKVALHHGLLSVMAIDLMPAGHPAPSGGAVNVYSRRRRGLTEHDRHMALLLSTHASLALAHTFAVEQGKAEHAHLRTAIESRDVIGQAKGILMARHGLTSDEAFDLLRRTSQHLNVKLADVAATFTERHRELEAP
ncbi:histidine kinase [Kibdelosporangium phytohabitans]|uniref:Histidine kinase n=1 Tax=Kibdelosporangium phytohabitans TaxID=860235 RepID=A0A0N9IHQ6_9PSEU|nr:histidine kinase [Kibdelosporangium phytohabitans]